MTNPMLLSSEWLCMYIGYYANDPELYFHKQEKKALMVWSADRNMIGDIQVLSSVVVIFFIHLRNTLDITRLSNRQFEKFKQFRPIFNLICQLEITIHDYIAHTLRHTHILFTFFWVVYLYFVRFSMVYSKCNTDFPETINWTGI